MQVRTTLSARSKRPRKYIINAMGLKLDMLTEVGIFEVRPDVWVVILNMLPVAVIRVKKVG
jgi:hypothetical protein